MINDLLSPEPLPETPAPIALVFTGNGGEYFRIWIVNLALTFVTFGIYSAWAKVRRLQYFYRNTQLDGSGFDYHGKPLTILKGRLIAFGLLGSFKIALAFSVTATIILGVLIAAVLPWLLVRSLAFRMRNSSWRGVRFGFNGAVAGGYRVFLLWPIASVLSLGLLAPAAYRAFKAYQHGNTAFGTAPFAFSATVPNVYSLWVRTAVMVFGVPILLTATASLLGAMPAASAGDLLGMRYPAVVVLLALAVIAFYVALLLAMPYFLARSQNLIWNHTTLGVHRFECSLRFRKVLWIVVSNVFLTVITIGLFRPFAVVRMARYRAESMTLVPGESLDHFVGMQSREVGAMGEEVAEFFDIDIAL